MITHTHTRTHTHAHTHARTHTHTHLHTHKCTARLYTTLHVLVPFIPSFLVLYLRLDLNVIFASRSCTGTCPLRRTYTTCYLAYKQMQRYHHLALILRHVLLSCTLCRWVSMAWHGTTLLLCCAVLCCAVLCCAVLCCAVLCCAVLCCAVLCSIPLSMSTSLFHAIPLCSLMSPHDLIIFHSSQLNLIM